MCRILGGYIHGPPCIVSDLGDVGVHRVRFFFAIIVLFLQVVFAVLYRRTFRRLLPLQALLPPSALVRDT